MCIKENRKKRRSEKNVGPLGKLERGQVKETLFFPRSSPLSLCEDSSGK